MSAPHPPPATPPPTAAPPPVSPPPAATTTATEVVKEGVHAALGVLPYLTDLFVLWHTIRGNRSAAREIQAFKASLGSKQTSGEVVTPAQAKIVLEQIQRAAAASDDAGIKALFGGIGAEDEGDMMWVLAEMLGYFQSLPKPDDATPRRFIRFLSQRPDGEISFFRLALSKIPSRAKQVEVVTRLARHIAATTDDGAKKESFENFLRSTGISRRPSPIAAGIARGIAASGPLADRRTSEKRTLIQRDIDAALNRPNLNLFNRLKQAWRIFRS